MALNIRHGKKAEGFWHLTLDRSELKLSLPQIAMDYYDPDQRHLPPNPNALDNPLRLCGVEAWVHPSISKEIQMVPVVVPGGTIAAYEIQALAIGKP